MRGTLIHAHVLCMLYWFILQGAPIIIDDDDDDDVFKPKKSKRSPPAPVAKKSKYIHNPKRLRYDDDTGIYPLHSLVPRPGLVFK